MKNVTILGSTGSIGVNTLDVLRRNIEDFSVFALTAHLNVDLLLKQCIEFRPQFAAMTSVTAARELEVRLKNSGVNTEVLCGDSALDVLASHHNVDIVMASIVGAAGLSSCISAALAGKRLLLANKEALVVGGDVFMNAVEKGKAILLPIDSEHSAIFQSLPTDRNDWSNIISKLILTASGGPFRTCDVDKLANVTPDEACSHPTWVMGRKISVDSATMMNKVLEVIEAKYLFNINPHQIDVVIHPQSVIHSMVQYIDNSIIAQLGTPDMRVPIAYGFSWPKRMTSGADPLDFFNLQKLSFESISEPTHVKRYPSLKLAWSVLDGQSGSPAILNAANEVAVSAFLEKKIRFDQIYTINAKTLDALVYSSPNDLNSLLELDLQARHFASQYCKDLQ